MWHNGEHWGGYFPNLFSILTSNVMTLTVMKQFKQVEK